MQDSGLLLQNIVLAPALRPRRHVRPAGQSRLQLKRHQHRGVLVVGPLNQALPTKPLQELSIKQDRSTTMSPSAVKHLIVMANGLYGNANNWDVVIENLQKVLDTSETLVVASDANSLKQVS